MRSKVKTMRKVTLMLAAMALAVLLAALPAQGATTFTVNATADASDADTTDGICATAAGQCTLRAAIEQANNVDGDDVIGFDPSVRGTIVLGGSQLTISSNLEINGPGAEVLSIDANDQRRVFGLYGATVGISGLTVTGGSTDAGGGIYNNGGTLTISNSTITGNTASSGGGGIYNLAGTVTVSNSTISGNTARDGGGINVPFVYDERDGGSLTVERSTISGNTATQSGGGIRSSTPAPSIYTTDKITIKNSTISGNTAEQEYGGGVYNNNGITEIEHSTITNNSAPSGMGSGVASFGVTFTSTKVLSSVISANTDTDNTDTDTGTDVDFVEGSTNSFSSEGYNLIGDGNATAAFNHQSGTQSTDKVGVSDPGLEPLSLNAPGSTTTHALQAASPALNAGPPSTECPPPATDQRGVARPQQGRCDIGSFESDTTAPRVIEVVPVENSTGIGPRVNVSATFSEAMRATSVKSAFKLYKKGSTTAIRATVTYDAATKRAVLNPSANLERGATYKAVITSRAKDLSGNALDQKPGVTGNQMKVWSFTIRG